MNAIRIAPAIAAATLAGVIQALAPAPAPALAADDPHDAPPCIEGVDWLFTVVGEDCSPTGGGSGSSSNTGTSADRRSSGPRPLQLPPETIVVVDTKPVDADRPLTGRSPRLGADSDAPRRSPGVRESAGMSPAPAKRHYPDWKDKKGWAKARDKARVCEELHKAIDQYYRDERLSMHGEPGFWRRLLRSAVHIGGGMRTSDLESAIARWKDGCDDLFPITVY